MRVTCQLGMSDGPFTKDTAEAARARNFQSAPPQWWSMASFWHQKRELGKAPERPIGNGSPLLEMTLSRTGHGCIYGEGSYTMTAFATVGLLNFVIDIICMARAASQFPRKTVATMSTATRQTRIERSAGLKYII